MPPPAGPRLVPLTTYPGIERNPAFSPDGRQIAFSWNGPGQDNFDIYVKPIGSAPPLRLTTNAADDFAPAWSPDGASIAFLRRTSSDMSNLMLIPALGGPERKVGEAHIPPAAWVSGPYLAWFPDGGALVVTDKRDGGANALFVMSAQSGARQPLTVPPDGVLGDGCAAVSSDGSVVAFCRGTSPGVMEIFEIAVGPDHAPRGEARQLTFEHTGVAGLAWAPDDRDLVFASARGGLWRLPAADLMRGAHVAPTRIEGVSGSWPAVSRQSARLAFSQAVGGDEDIWRAAIARAGEPQVPPTRLIASTKSEFAQQYSPDGTKITFESRRSGNLEIWVCDADGANAVQLTSLGSEFTGTPSWSPDGRQIAFYSRVNGKAQIFLVPSDGGGVTRFTTNTSEDFFPRWSRDGAWIYFASNRTGANQLWKQPSHSGPAIQVTRNGGFAASESPDGKWVYYTRTLAEDSSLWRMPLGGGDEQLVLPSVIFQNFAVVDDGVYFIRKDERAFAIWFAPAAGGAPRLVVPVGRGYVGLCVSPDRRWILYTESNPQGNDLMLVENFR